MQNLQLIPPPEQRVIRGITVEIQQQPDPDPRAALTRLCGTIDDHERPGSYTLADGRHYHPPSTRWRCTPRTGPSTTSATPKRPGGSRQRCATT